MSLKTACHLGLGVLDILEKLHRAGYVYNDIKMENLYVGQGEHIKPFDESTNSLENCQIHLIDFGLCEKYYDH